METVSKSRRNFITTLIMLLGGSGLLWRYLTPGLGQPRQVLISVAKEEIPPEGALVYRETRVALFRGEQGFYALNLVCTHLGCTVNVTAEQITCPCHGSRFDTHGQVLQGPADRPLQRLKVEERQGMVEVYAA